MLISLSKVLETPVDILLGDNISDISNNNLKIISEKLDLINLELIKKQQLKMKKIKWILIILCILIILTFILLLALVSPYLKWDYNNLEMAFIGIVFHYFEWTFIRVAPLILSVLLLLIMWISSRIKKM